MKNLNDLTSYELHFLRHLVEKHREDFLYISRERQNTLLEILKQEIKMRDDYLKEIKNEFKSEQRV